MKNYSQNDLIGALKSIGLKKGDVVLVSTELFTLGHLKQAKSSEDLNRLVLEAIFHVIGRDEGTVAVHTYTTYTGRYGIPFDYNRSRPVTGSFSEYVLFHPESVRSFHPINSVAAIGKHKKEICFHVSKSNYGLESPPDRMLNLGCQVLRLGIDYGHNVFTHYVETCYGVPYVYNKLLSIESTGNSKKIEAPFFASVFHLELNVMEYNLEPLKKELVAQHVVHSTSLGAGSIHRLDAKEYCKTLLELIKKDPYILLKNKPDYVKGEKPYDGITQGRDGINELPNDLSQYIYSGNPKDFDEETLS